MLKEVSSIKKHQEKVLLNFPNAGIEQKGDWFYITKNKALPLGAYIVLASGRTEESAWRNAYDKLRHDWFL